MSVRADPDLPEFLGGAEEFGRPRPSTPVRRSSSVGKHVPGEAGIWIFILGDMTFFGAVMLVLLFEHRRHPRLIAESAGQLLPNIGAMNTVVLLVSSYCVVRALYAQRADNSAAVRRGLVGAIGCAVAFVVLKGSEFVHEFDIGNTAATNIFFTYYFALTGLHLVHVLIGVGLLTGWFTMSRRGRNWQSGRMTFETIAVYWHMVDLLWIAIFTVAYLVCAQ
jgi:nitric oxide reductase NorE protein